MQTTNFGMHDHSTVLVETMIQQLPATWDMRASQAGMAFLGLSKPKSAPSAWYGIRRVGSAWPEPQLSDVLRRYWRNTAQTRASLFRPHSAHPLRVQKGNASLAGQAAIRSEFDPRQIELSQLRAPFAIPAHHHRRSA
ncbi:hypothetical protein NRB56_54260 [Nocardia sp. RB56]|uniref:Uncharacterized protein n=1 Tax=Nocardia aurantia TaxID=2585199 RepID=A0A7K0DVM1_9NOCA|nr:hypothetical protein [Nocardia aurantia]